MKRMNRWLFIMIFMLIILPLPVYASDVKALNGESVQTVSSPEEMVDIICPETDTDDPATNLPEGEEEIVTETDSLSTGTNTIMIDSETLTDTHDADNAVYYSRNKEYYLNYQTPEEAEDAYEYYQKKYGEDKVLMDLPIHTMAFKSWGNKKTNIAPVKACANLERKNKVLVAVIDSGLNRSHVAFSGRSISAKSQSFLGESWKDDCGHGTHTAGIIAEATSKNVRFLILKVTDKKGNGSLFNLLMALDYAADCKAKVANVSLGINLQDVADRFYKKNKIHLDTEKYIRQIEDKIAVCRKRGLVIVAASGNSKSSMDKKLVYPARSKQVISVGACDKKIKRASFSNYGSTLDFVAPGVSVKSAYLGGKRNYVVLSGTSMAAPHITAEAAMIRVYHPSYRFKKVYETLVSYTGRDSRISDQEGYGMPVMPSPPVDKVSGLKTKSLTPHQLKVRWNPISNALGYNVYMLDNGSWKKLKSTKKNYLKAGSLKLGKKYYFKVKGFYKASGKRYYGPMSDEGWGVPVFAPPKSVKVNRANKKIKISWEKTKGATGYELYRAVKKKGPYKKVKTTDKAVCKIKDTPGTREYFKLRAYKIKNGLKCYGQFCVFHDKDEVLK